MTKVSTYSLSLHTFDILSVITQELCSVHIMVLCEFDKRVLKAKIDFLNNASKFKILYCNFPDLNSIKNVWNLINDKVHGK